MFGSDWGLQIKGPVFDEIEENAGNIDELRHSLNIALGVCSAKREGTENALRNYHSELQKLPLVSSELESVLQRIKLIQRDARLVESALDKATEMHGAKLMQATMSALNARKLHVAHELDTPIVPSQKDIESLNSFLNDDE